MAYVHIYPEHREVLDGLISSAKVGSQLGALATGPFKDQRDAYVFAASIGIALGHATPAAEMPKSKRKEKPIDIRDTVLFGSDGARELSLAAVLLQELDDSDSVETGLRRQLQQVAEDDLVQRLALLDRYAYAGFEWLTTNLADAGTIRALVMEAVDHVVGVELDPVEILVGEDPLGNLLL